MAYIPYTHLDYTRPIFGHFPTVTQGYHYVPTYKAQKTETGADVFRDDIRICSFPSMEEACQYVQAQST